jgi:putative oxidoreductase
LITPERTFYQPAEKRRKPVRLYHQEAEMFSKIFRTNPDIVPAIIRVVVGVLFFVHGAQKMLGWWGGPGFSTMMSGFESQGIPPVLAFLAIAAEFFGGLGMILGFLTRIAAFGISVNMVVAIFTVHLQNGLFMNWTGQQKGEGFEYHLLVLAITISIMLVGAGAYSIDGMIYKGEAYRQPASRIA